MKDSSEEYRLKNCLINEIAKKIGCLKKEMKVEKISRHSLKYRISSNRKNFYLYLYKGKKPRKNEADTLKKIESKGIIAPRLVCTGDINGGYYYNLVSDIGMKSLEKQEGGDYKVLAKKIFAALNKLHSIKEGGKCLSHRDLHPSNICFDGKNIGLLDFSYSGMDKETADFAWIYLAQKVFEKRKDKNCWVYKGVWNLFAKSTKINKYEIGGYIKKYSREKRFDNELAEDFVGECIDSLNNSKKIPRRRGIKTLHVNIGHSCNNNCIFCMEDREARTSRKNIPVSSFEETLRDSAGMFSRVVFTSGEPTLNAFLPELIEYAKSKGYKEICLMTNARRLSYAKFCNLLAKKGLNIIGVSMHAHNEKLHESLTRTPGSFSQTIKALKNIQNLKSKGKIKEFNIHTTITKLNFMFLEEIYDFLSQFNPNSLIFNMFNPKGAAKKRLGMVMPKYSQVTEVLGSMHSKGKRNFALIDFPPCTVRNMLHRLGSIEDYHIMKEQSYRGNDKNGGRAYKKGALEGKVHMEKCGGCSMQSCCQGVSAAYLEKFGDREFAPIIPKNEKQ